MIKMILWSIILLIAAFDCAYAIANSETLLEWEMNPVACLFYHFGGIGSVLCLRFGVLLFAVAMSYTDTRFSKYVLPSWTMGHLFLVGVYMIG